MRIIISPAKKMNEDRDSFPPLAVPVFADRAEFLRDFLKSLSYEDAKKLWSCNDKLAELNYDRFQEMSSLSDLPRLTPAILSYEGIQYQYMAPHVFSRNALEFVQEHLCILSGFYGVLKPFDGVTPYRLEMQARVDKFDFPEGQNLYEYWGSDLYDEVQNENPDRLILNLASKEYSKCIEKYLQPEDMYLTVVFGELKTDPKTGRDKVITKGTLAKMARGDMVRHLAEHDCTTPKDVKAYNGLGFNFCPERSTEFGEGSSPTLAEYVFLKTT